MRTLRIGIVSVIILVVLISTSTGVLGATTIPQGKVLVYKESHGVYRFEEYVPLFSDDLYYRVNIYAIKVKNNFVLVDTGVYYLFDILYSKILETLKKAPVAVLVTHGHADHAGAGSMFIAQGIPVYAPKGDIFMIQMGNKFPGVNPLFTYPEYQPSGTFTPGNIIFDLLVVPTPGHTPGSVSFFDLKSKMLFCADATISKDTDVLGQNDLTYYIQYQTLLAQNVNNLKMQLKSLELLKFITIFCNDITVFPGHGQSYYGRWQSKQFILYSEGIIQSLLPP
jgi:glyoxylase-like metal-dependent hydrolase (beta-lactamase superfamily II)